MMPSRDLSDCTPTMAQNFEHVRLMFEGNLPAWMLRIECTLRSDAEQLAAFLEGTSEIDPRIPEQRRRAMHLAYGPSGKSRAIDVEIISRASGRSADKLLAIGALTQGSYDLLYLTLMLIVERFGMRSGNDWNQNGIAVGPDKKEGFFDGGHMEQRDSN